MNYLNKAITLFLLVYSMHAISAQEHDTTHTMHNYQHVAALIKTLENQSPFTPENTALAWDLDDVLLEKHIAYALWIHCYTLATMFVRPTITSKAINKVYSSGIGSIDPWITLFKENNADDLAAMAQYIADTKEPIPGTVKIVHEFGELKFAQLYATNMGEHEVEQHKLQERNDFFKRFHDGIAICYDKGSKIEKKPDLPYFKRLIATMPSNKPYKIFIDNELKNVEGARQAGMIGIHFENPKQLRNEFVKMGILQACIE